jgi:PAS domain S-box-containing protein
VHNSRTFNGTPPHVADISSDMEDTHNSIYYAAVSTTRMPMVLTDPNQPDNPIIFANPAFLNLSGYDADELLGRNCRMLQGPETDPEVVNRIRRAIDDRKEISVEILNYKKNQSSFWNALYICPILDPEGNLQYFFSSQLDVTRRHDVEAALYQSQKMEAVGQLTGGIAHDFNNLLTVIHGFAELIETHLQNANPNIARIQRSVGSILQAAERGSKLTSQLLAFSRKQKLEGRIVSMKDLTVQLTTLIEKSVGEGVVLKFEHEENACNVRLDPVQAELAIINIAVNARDAMGGVGEMMIKTCDLNITSDDTIFGNIEHGMYSCLSITDNGIGMDTSVLNRITEPFFTTKSEGKGTGLGMSMVYGFVKQSGGALAIESEIGKGTTVHMLFKCVEGDVDQVVAKAHRELEGRKGEKETVLLVEDRMDVAELATLILTDFGYTVFHAENATLALDILTKEPEIQVLFSDIIMPGNMNGVQLAREAVRRKPDLKILLTTGYTDSTIDVTDINGQPFHLINKPYDKSTLINGIRNIIDGPNGIS